MKNVRLFSYLGSFGACALALLFVSNPAQAGYKVNGYNVYHSAINGSTSGTFADARSAANTNEYIYCRLSAIAGYAVRAYCGAADAAGNFYYCSSSDPSIITTITSMTSNSYIWFQPTSSGSCNQVAVETDSSLAPIWF